MPRSLFTLSTMAALTTLFIGCSAGAPIEQQKISIVTATPDGLTLAYHTEDLSFRLVAVVDGDISRSKIVRDDGTVADELEIPRDLKAYGDPRTLTVIEDAAGKAFIPDAAELRLAVEEMVTFAATTRDERADLLQYHLEMVLQQVLLLTAAEEGISFSPVCPEYLADPEHQVYHTIDDHRAQIEQMQLPKAMLCHWYNPCCLHDYACITCGAGIQGGALLCGWNCEPGMECMGRCGGGCGDTK